MDCKECLNEMVVGRTVKDFFDIEAKGRAGSVDESESDDGSMGSFVVPDSQCSFESALGSDDGRRGSDVQHEESEGEAAVVDSTFGKSVAGFFFFFFWQERTELL
jgi:hypothetical protein